MGPSGRQFCPGYSGNIVSKSGREIAAKNGGERNSAVFGDRKPQVKSGPSWVLGVPFRDLLWFYKAKKVVK